VRGALVYCADYRCSHSLAMSGNRMSAKLILVGRSMANHPADPAKEGSLPSKVVTRPKITITRQWGEIGGGHG
jgi:hypothetical protein